MYIKMEHWLQVNWKVGLLGAIVGLMPVLDVYDGITGSVAATLGVVLLGLSIYAKWQQIKKDKNA